MLTLDQERIENTMYIERVSLANCKGEDDQAAPTAERWSVERAVSSKTLPATPPKEVEYVVDSTIRHSGPTTDGPYTM